MNESINVLQNELINSSFMKENFEYLLNISWILSTKVKVLSL